MLPISDLLERLRAALRASDHRWRDATLELLPDKGLAHHHVRLVGTGALARLPKQSQLGLGAAANLAYQRACFERAAVSGFTPQYLGFLPVSVDLPRGALLVQEIVGRSALLPADLRGMARSLASMHMLALPPESARPPLLNVADPLAALANEISEQAAHLPAVAVDSAVALTLGRELERLRRLCSATARPECRLIAFDAHPGNFIVDADGKAVLVDLEKCRYSYPGLDLAHATLYTSTTWDVNTRASLTVRELIDFYAAWSAAVGSLSADAQAWHVPLRRAMWLWSISWCVKWRALSGLPAAVSADGEDWAAEGSDHALVAHVRDRVDHYLSPGVVEQVLEEFEALERAFRT
jgi:thiamine kinase-like enzyme